MQNLALGIKIKRYDPLDKRIWDQFVDVVKNPHFFFRRDYMDYHADRFQDHSLMFYDDKEKLIAVLPANIDQEVLYSHQGLSFGGLLMDKKISAIQVMKLFETLIGFLKQAGIKKLVYKAMPYTYHSSPAQEDLYALSYYGALLYRRDISSTLDLSGDIKFQDRRKRSIKKAVDSGLQVSQSHDYGAFWQILTDNLQSKYQKNPVHNLSEITKLAGLFSANIKLFVASKENQILAGVLVYENLNIVHTQYLANSTEGKDLGALDLVIDYLINTAYKSKTHFFDFGISCENNGKYLNTGLIEQKEGFGARAVTHDFYELEF